MRLLDRAWALHDRLLANPRFQRWAAGFPLTRPVAARRSRALFDLCAGFVYSQVLVACVRLDLFNVLAAGPQSVASLVEQLQLAAPATERLLLAAASLRLVCRRGDGFGLGVLGAAMLGNPAVAAMVQHHVLLYADLQDPVALLRGERAGTLGGFWPYAAGEPAAAGEVSGYSALMAESQALVAADVLEAAPLAGVRCLMDVGGGDGTFLVEAARVAPDMRLVLFDLAPVAERAAARFASAGLGGRATTVAGSFRRDALPHGADAISLVRVLHDHDDAVAAALLRAARMALPPGGRIIVAEPMAETPGAESVGHAYFGFYLLAMGSGRPRTAAEITALLRAAGFVRVRERPTRRPMLVRLMTAVTPKV